MSLPHSLRTAASPPCHQCGNPILRIEQSWQQVPDGWIPKEWLMICEWGHRVAVEPLGSGPL